MCIRDSLDTVYTDKVELTVLVPDDEEGFLMKELMEGMDCRHKVVQ